MIIHIEESHQPLTAPDRVHEILQTVLNSESPADRDKEHIWVFYLDNRRKIKALELVALGTLTEILIHPREIFTQAITYRCAAIILAHNHPSGNPGPSDSDIKATRRIYKAGEILGIELLDHVITATEGFTSLKQRGHL
jgi:DNA repair protein RadC